MMNNKKKKNKQHSKTRNQETKLRENINSEGEEQSVKPQQFIRLPLKANLLIYLICLTLSLN